MARLAMVVAAVLRPAAAVIIVTIVIVAAAALLPRAVVKPLRLAAPWPLALCRVR
jgi:hypothetical protein